MSRPLYGFVAIVLAGALLQGYGITLGMGRGYWVAVLATAVVAAVGLRSSQRLEGGASGGEYLCDSCRFNDQRYCSRPERPNATRCEDYRSRG